MVEGVSNAPDTVWRRIPPRHFPDKPTMDRPKSPAFMHDPDGDPMSVIYCRADRTPMEVLAGHEGFGLVELRIDDLGALGLAVVPNPLPNEPTHASVVGDISHAVRKSVANQARWVVPAGGPHPPAAASTQQDSTAAGGDALENTGRATAGPGLTA